MLLLTFGWTCIFCACLLRVDINSRILQVLGKNTSTLLWWVLYLNFCNILNFSDASKHVHFHYSHSIIFLLGRGPHIRNKDAEGEFLHRFTYGRFTMPHSRIITFASEKYSLLPHISWKKPNEKELTGVWRETSRKIHDGRIDFWLKMSACALLCPKRMATQKVPGRCFSAVTLIRTKCA